MVSLFGRGFESLQLHPKKRTWHLICQVLFLYHAKEGQIHNYSITNRKNPLTHFFEPAAASATSPLNKSYNKKKRVPRLSSQNSL